MPTMAKTPTLATWKLERLRTLENVVRRGHLQAVDRGKLTFADGSVAIAQDAIVVHCAADGLKYPPLVPVWRPQAITLQAIRAWLPRLRCGIDRVRRGAGPRWPRNAARRCWLRSALVGAEAALVDASLRKS